MMHKSTLTAAAAVAALVFSTAGNAVPVIDFETAAQTPGSDSDNEGMSFELTRMLPGANLGWDERYAPAMPNGGKPFSVNIVEAADIEGDAPETEAVAAKPVPEPPTVALAGLALLGLGMRRYTRRLGARHEPTSHA